MKTFLDCVPCLVRQSLDAVRLHTSDVAIHEELLREVLRAACEMDLRQSPPQMAQQIHRKIRELTGQDDPYRRLKDQFNELGLRLYASLQQHLGKSDNPLETAVRLAIAGNVIDFGVNSHLEAAQVEQAVLHALSEPLCGDVEEFRRAVSAADDILYLTDNAGEIVFDRLLIEQLPRQKVTAVVKGGPVINDATMADAQTAGLTELVEVIDTGSDAPGTLLDDCSEAFCRRFDRAGLVIAKGQANYETLGELDKEVYFLLKAKCAIIAEDIGQPVGSIVLKRSARVAVVPQADSDGDGQGERATLQPDEVAGTPDG